VWKVSGRNPLFPPERAGEWLSLLKNNPADSWVLPYAFRSVKETARKTGISNPDFFRFLDEQLIISAQSPSHDTPFLFGAPAITYTNSTNYYVPGGLLEMIRVIQGSIEKKGGVLHVKEPVGTIEKKEGYFEVRSSKEVYRAKKVVSNLPVWNMADILKGEGREYFKRESDKYSEAWGAFTMGIATTDVYPEDMAIHHQIHLDQDDQVAGIESGSVFVSFSHPEDQKRAPKGERVLNVSTHARPDFWFNLNGRYDETKEQAHNQILRVLRKKLPYFNESEIKVAFSSTPVSWSNWVYRKRGRVGGIPQSMDRSLLDWTSNTPPVKGLYLCGDTVFPGQGIPGVALSGFNAWYKIIKSLINDPVH
ncbi:MAG: FAD-dependent oxidoreductase, partial [Balneolaceae bacterium]|nr:FAD-dependent oxidoreductase [Balneolaceae bacterium]